LFFLLSIAIFSLDLLHSRTFPFCVIFSLILANMSGVQGHVLGHIVRRGVQHVAMSDTYQQLQQDAAAYENAGPDFEVSPYELLPLLFTFLAIIVITSSIQYTVGSVVASLAMIESPVNTTIVEEDEDKPPAYADEPDAPLLKEELLPSEAVADVEVACLQQAPVTSSVRATVRHLRAQAGFWSRWRGLRVSAIYHGLHSYGVNASMRWFGLSPVTHVIAFTFFTVGLSQLHMAWTHSMIAMPSQKSFWRRLVPCKNARPVLLPNMVLAAAQMATIYLPLGVAALVDLPELSKYHANKILIGEDVDAISAFFLRLRLIAIPATFILCAFCVLLPATVTLTRIEALLLAEGEETIVPFDRQAIIAGIDMDKRGSSFALFAAAWRSFNSAARWRLIKVYAKMTGMQFAVGIIGVVIMILQLNFIGFDRLALLAQSAIAQIQLAAMQQ